MVITAKMMITQLVKDMTEKTKWRKKIKMAKTVTKQMMIGELLQIDEAVVQILLESGMGCIGCPSA